MTPFICYTFDIVCRILNKWERNKQNRKWTMYTMYASQMCSRWWSIVHMTWFSLLSAAAVSAARIMRFKNWNSESATKQPNLSSVCKQIYEFIFGQSRRSSENRSSKQVQIAKTEKAERKPKLTLDFYAYAIIFPWFKYNN